MDDDDDDQMEEHDKKAKKSNLKKQNKTTKNRTAVQQMSFNFQHQLNSNRIMNKQINENEIANMKLQELKISLPHNDLLNINSIVNDSVNEINESLQPEILTDHEKVVQCNVALPKEPKLINYEFPDPIHSVYVMKLWQYYSKGENFIEGDNLAFFLNDFAEYKDMAYSYGQSLDFQAETLQIYGGKDKNAISLQTFYAMLPVEKNYLASTIKTKFTKKLTDNEILIIFKHYDVEGKKVLNRDEMLSLLRDMGKLCGYNDFGAEELKEYLDSLLLSANVTENEINKDKLKTILNCLMG